MAGGETRRQSLGFVETRHTGSSLRVVSNGAISAAEIDFTTETLTARILTGFIERSASAKPPAARQLVTGGLIRLALVPLLIAADRSSVEIQNAA